MRVVEAEQKPSGDWIVTFPGGDQELQPEGLFRRKWEPVNDQARRLWVGGPRLSRVIGMN
jgi:hypothetical protein